MDSLTIEADGSERERETMFAWLRSFNENANGDFMQLLADGGEKPFFFAARSRGQLVGGLDGLTIGKWMRINLMAVDPSYRGQGVGRQLVDAAISLGIRRGCLFGYVDTMSYQAPDFYRKLGFLEVGRLVDWDSHGHDKLFFSKPLESTIEPAP